MADPVLIGKISSEGMKLKGLLLGDPDSSLNPIQGKIIGTDDIYLQVGTGKNVYVTIGTTSAAISLEGHTHSYQAADADLLAIGGLSDAATGFLKKTGANTWSLDGSSYSLSSHNHSGVYQPLDADLTSIAGLAGTSGFLKKTAADTWWLDTNSYMPTSHAANAITGFGSTGVGTTVARSDHNHSGTYQAYDLVLDNITALGGPANLGYVKKTGTSSFTVLNETYMQTSHAANSITGFGGTGSATTVARSDHLHDSNYTSLGMAIAMAVALG